MFIGVRTFRITVIMECSYASEIFNVSFYLISYDEMIGGVRNR